MASWNDFFGDNIHNYNSQVPAWMTVNDGTGPSQVLRYPAHEQSNYHVYSPWPTYNSEDALSENTVVLKVPICCEGCEERVKSRLIDIDGVQGVHCDQLQHKVTVTGTASPNEILNECKKLFKRSNWWPSQ